MAGARETEEFARLLSELKNRSGLSYGALAKRLHMSTSTLHRYCNGTALPSEYAPVERLARVCRATPQELVELHRGYVLADAARRFRGEGAAAARDEDTGPSSEGPGEAAEGPTASPAVPANGFAAATPTGPGAPGDFAQAGGDGQGQGDGGTDEPLVVRVDEEPPRPRRRRTALIASAGMAAVLIAALLTVHPPWGGGGDDTKDRQALGPAASTGAADSEGRSATPSTSGPSRTPSTSPSTSKSATAGTGASHDPGTTAGAWPTGAGNAVPLTVHTRPYAYEDPCSQHFLVNNPPARVGPPASEDEATHWAAVYGAVSSGEQDVALTIQGTGSDTVVLEALHVSVESKDAPLAWNDYSMGVGCGGGVGTKSFDVDLDKGSPTAVAKNGQRDFPYKVSESDPEVFYVIAHTAAHDVRWQLSLDWTSGDRHGTVLINDEGTTFRTSADVDRPGYDYPIGNTDWIPREGG
ncbi:Transcriptional regulator, contains XRE-family HTH domain [Actinacidiphila yanglinensis]|uniref:Transcriptional regulator, contains XRE-family HTH domain n=1 Tax=Actinacidiphila yanglinensis TaxID=310779 RepID=A0A1H6DTT6_9ACTN|nr:Transcriptional regulator, contains XRE-family HTH domain [Actinacidiphila yanglinensis]